MVLERFPLQKLYREEVWEAFLRMKRGSDDRDMLAFEANRCPATRRQLSTRCGHNPLISELLLSRRVNRLQG